MVATLFFLLAILLAASTPIFIALSGSVLVVFALFNDIPLVIIIQRMFAGLNKFALMSIPFFVLAANLMGEGGISKRVIRLANVMIGSFPGGLGMTAILASMFFGAISGSAPATVVAIGALLYPALKEQNYGESYAIGVITSAGALGIIIPPSVTMIIYGAVTGSSVGTLFVAGFGAGLIYAVGYMVYTYFFAKKNVDIGMNKKATMAEFIEAIKDSGWGVGVPVIILGGIYGGIFTPTEAAAVAVAYALFVAMVIYRELDLKGLYNVLRSSAVTTAQVMILLAAASVFAWILTAEGITVAIASAVLSISSNTYVILLLMNIVILIAGMFLDGASIVMILGPLFYPIAMQAGIDPIHLGVIITVNCAIGMFTPPFGLNLFVASSLSELSITKVSKSVIPFIMISVVALLLITYIPSISLWLPRRVYGVW
ncbi:TRAP transporter large permease [Natronincola ferrireducens]|uniref:C4-dicarboxylate transporter, DctM subunit n=1 Tax=Natronincola ferrireducens TaxID=393762 RepID=A0A1G9G1U0_9FIRM|nr:TRAP transporter large permease [Natronincola ferrireducens]SDK94577.1 C4-dicarboxylate transporter, DctM subunit [Natronincola ferrireducens]